MSHLPKLSGYYSPKALLLYVCFALMFLFPLGKNEYVLHIMIMSFIFVMLGLSWNLLSGYTGQLSFAHAAFYGIGAYGSALSTMSLGVSPWVGLFLGGTYSALFGFLIGVPCCRLKGRYLALTTFAFGETARMVVYNWVDLTRGPLGLWGFSGFPGIPDTYLSYYYLGLFFLCAILFVTFIVAERSYIGLFFKAIREDEVLAQNMGLDLNRYKLLAFTLSAFLAGFVGGFYAHYIRLLTPDSLYWYINTQTVAIVQIGGPGHIMGPVLGGLLLEPLSEYLRVVGVTGRFIVFGAILIATVIFLPEGIMGKLIEGANVIRENLRKLWK